MTRQLRITIGPPQPGMETTLINLPSWFSDMTLAEKRSWIADRVEIAIHDARPALTASTAIIDERGDEVTL